MITCNPIIYYLSFVFLQCRVALSQVYEDEPVLQAFKLMRKKRVGGIPVIEKGGRAVGNISLRDIHFLLTAPEIYHDYRFVINILILISLC